MPPQCTHIHTQRADDYCWLAAALTPTQLLLLLHAAAPRLTSWQCRQGAAECAGGSSTVPCGNTSEPPHLALPINCPTMATTCKQHDTDVCVSGSSAGPGLDAMQAHTQCVCVSETREQPGPLCAAKDLHCCCCCCNGTIMPAAAHLPVLGCTAVHAAGLPNTEDALLVPVCVCRYRECCRWCVADSTACMSPISFRQGPLCACMCVWVCWPLLTVWQHTCRGS